MSASRPGRKAAPGRLVPLMRISESMTAAALHEQAVHLGIDGIDPGAQLGKRALIAFAGDGHSGGTHKRRPGSRRWQTGIGITGRTSIFEGKRNRTRPLSPLGEGFRPPKSGVPDFGT